MTININVMMMNDPLSILMNFQIQFFFNFIVYDGNIHTILSLFENMANVPEEIKRKAAALNQRGAQIRAKMSELDMDLAEHG
jgi:hypothetical protein